MIMTGLFSIEYNIIRALHSDSRKVLSLSVRQKSERERVVRRSLLLDILSSHATLGSGDLHVGVRTHTTLRAFDTFARSLILYIFHAYNNMYYFTITAS